MRISAIVEGKSASSGSTCAKHGHKYRFAKRHRVEHTHTHTHTLRQIAVASVRGATFREKRATQQGQWDPTAGEEAQDIREPSMDFVPFGDHLWQIRFYGWFIHRLCLNRDALSAENNFLGERVHEQVRDVRRHPPTPWQTALGCQERNYQPVRIFSLKSFLILK